jgi:hypothetical protein
MANEISLGTARGVPGKLAYGRWHAFDHPTGTPEELPVIIAQGARDGPTFWVTANIHGPELTGIAVIHDLLSESLARKLRGALVCIPSLTPAGFRVRNRQPYFDPQDPNRLFPDRKKKDAKSVAKDDEPEYPSMIEQVWARLFDEIKSSADYLIDLHNAAQQSIPFSIRDKVFYESDADRAEAERLQERTGALIQALGLPAVFEFSRKRYLQLKLNRSTSGAALNLARIPSFTAELGAPNIVDDSIVAAAVNGLHNCLVTTGMLDEPLRPVDVPRIPATTQIRRENHPRAPQTGLMRHRVHPGDAVKAGDIVVTLTDIYGCKPADVPTERDGWVLGLSSGMSVFKHGVMCTLAVRDDEPLVMKWDEDGAPPP